MKKISLAIMIFVCIAPVINTYSQSKSKTTKNDRGGFEYFVGIVGNPSAIADIKWDDKQLAGLKELGVNMLQLSVAWGGKPDDEVINLEDLNAEQVSKWKYRIKQAKKFGFKTMAHFGIPKVLNGDPVKPSCILEDSIIKKYTHLVKNFMSTFPEVNDMLVYTYDQQAWICSEFGPCPRCTGIPLGDRLPAFLTLLKTTMQESRPNGEARLWWKPWEISKGQTIDILQKIDANGFGLMLNSSTSNEVYPFNDGSFKSDLGVKRMVQFAYEHGIPVIGEINHTLYKPLYQIDDYFPRLIYEQMNAWKEMPGVVGVKEYYGFAPSTYSVNFSMLKAWMKEPDASLDMLLQKIAEPYGKKSAPWVIKAWESVAQAVEAFPWDVTYNIGPMGLDLNQMGEHDWDFVKITNGTWNTPIWEANRRANFMLTDAKVAHPWIFEDAGLRLEDASALNFRAAGYFDKAIAEKEGMVKEISRQRDLIYNLARSLRGKALHFALTIASHDARTVQGEPEQFEKVCGRIRRLLQEDIANGYQMAAEKLKDFNKDPKAWLQKNFHPLTWKSDAHPNWNIWIAPER